jgi:hypothetical protein
MTVAALTIGSLTQVFNDSLHPWISKLLDEGWSQSDDERVLGTIVPSIIGSDAVLH